MSRIGKRVLSIPENVNVNVDNNTVTVKGPKGELTLDLVKGINVKVEDNTVVVEMTKNDKFTHAMHGTTNANIRNMIIGVSEGYVRYQVHLLNGGWLPEVDGYDIDDDENGYAGNGRTPIDALKAVFYTPGDYEYQCLYMQVSPQGMDEYYPVQIDDQTVNGQDGYAGCFGRYIDKVQLWVE